MNIQDTPQSLAHAVSNIMAGRSIEKVELTEAKETTVPFEKMNILTPDQWDQVLNFKNFNEKEWKWNAIQKKFIRLKKIKEEDVEESNEFTAAAAKAKLAGKDEFEFDGKTYPVEIEQDAAEKILGKKESADLEEAIKVKTHRGMYSIKKGEESLKSWVEKIVIMSDAVKQKQRKTITQNIVKAIESGKIKNADLTQGLTALIGIDAPADMEAPDRVVKSELKKLGLLESTDLEEAVKFWTVTITKKAGKLFKGQTVDVKASNSAEAIKKGLKQMKVDNPMTVPSGSVDAVLAESLEEAAKPSNGTSTVGLDVVDAKSAMKDMKKFKLKAKEGKGNGSADEVIVTGKNADIFKYLTSDYYDMDTDEIEEFYPELYEGVISNVVKSVAAKFDDAAVKKLIGAVNGSTAIEVIIELDKLSPKKRANLHRAITSWIERNSNNAAVKQLTRLQTSLKESTDLEEAIVYRDIRIAIELLKTTPDAIKFRNLIAKKDQDAKISASDLKKAKEVFANPNDKDKANIEKKRKDRYFPRFGVKALEEESTEDLEEATMSQGVKTAATQIYSLEKSLKVGSNLNKGINKSLEGKYDADFKKMQKAIGDIITVWEEIERDFSDMNEVEEPKAQGEKDFKALHAISATDPEEAGNDQPIAPRP